MIDFISLSDVNSKDRVIPLSSNPSHEIPDTAINKKKMNIALVNKN